MPKKPATKPSGDANEHYNIGVRLMGSIERSLRSGELTDAEQSVAAEAEKSLLEALAIAPNHGRAMIMIGMLYRYTGRFDEAVDPLKAAMSLPRDCDDWTKAVDTLAAVYMNTDAHRNAVKLLEDAVKDHAGDPYLVTKLAACHDHLGKPAEAKRVLEAGLKAAPGNATLGSALAEVNDKLGVAAAVASQAALPPEAKALQDKAMKLGQALQKKMESIMNGGGTAKEQVKKVAAAQAEYQAAVMKLYNP